MNRPFKFRVWDKENKTWHNPNILEVWEETGNLEPYQYIKTGKLDPIYMPLDNWIIQEYTGVKDKDGKEIYEGDIIEYTYEIYEHDFETGNIGEVYFEDGAFIFDRKRGFCYFDSNFLKNTIKVIGNICENAELIKTT